MIESLDARVLLSTTIASGQTIVGNITSGSQSDTYSFAATASQTFEVNVGVADGSSAFLPVLHIYDPSGTEVDANSTHSSTVAESSVRLIYKVPASDTGNYTAVVSTAAPSRLGTYAIELASAPAAQTADADGDGGTIASGQTRAGTINRPGDVDVFTFSATAGQTFEMSLGASNNTSSTFEPLLYIYDPSGNLVDPGMSHSSQQAFSSNRQIATAVSGTYTVLVQDYQITGNGGTYDLELAAAPATQATDADGDGGTITSGQTRTGTINRPGDLDVFTFHAAASDNFSFTLGPATGSNYLPLVDIYNSSGTQVASTGTSTAGTSVTASYNVPSTGAGTYTAVVQCNTSAIGSYTINLTGATPAAVAPTVSSTQIGTGVAQRSSIKTFGVTFSEPVTLAAGAYTLYQEPLTSTGAINTSGTPTDVTSGVTASNSGNIITFTVTPGGALDRTAATTKAGFLLNGIFRLVLHGAKITDSTGMATLNGGADLNVSFASAEAAGGTSTYFHVLFGDYNGDGTVNLVDYRQFTRDYLANSGNSNYDISFDYNGDGTINLLDYRQLTLNYLQQFSY